MDIKHLKIKEKLGEDMVRNINRDLQDLPKEIQIEALESLSIEGTKKLIKYNNGKISIVEIQTMLDFLSQMVYVDCLDYYDAKEFLNICEKTLKEFKKKLFRK